MNLTRSGRSLDPSRREISPRADIDFGLRLPDTTALAEVLVRLLTAGHGLLGATDHGVNLAVYLLDPDGNGVELMVDRPSTDWPRAPDGSIAMRVAPLDVTALVIQALAES